MRSVISGPPAVLTAAAFILFRVLVLGLPRVAERYPDNILLDFVAYEFIAVSVIVTVISAFAYWKGTAYTLALLVAATLNLLWRFLELQFVLCRGASYYQNESLCESLTNVPICIFPIAAAGLAAVHVRRQLRRKTGE